jgi:hypothetical protein
MTCPPIPDDPPYDDGYVGGSYAGGADPYATDPYAYEDPYAAEFMNEYWYSPYYDTDPVEFAYTPADIPPRAPVVRPDRTTLVSLIVPSQFRTPLYNLDLIQRPSADAGDLPDVSH